MRRRSAQIMQDFFKETNLRDKLQEQCDDLGREVDNLQSEKAKLRKQLADAQAAIVEKDRAIAGGTETSPSEQRAHTILVEDMEKKFAHENKQLEEQVRAKLSRAVSHPKCRLDPLPLKTRDLGNRHIRT
jgi:predicted  nucleic acid-binding Zn-ribbon protein